MWGVNEIKEMIDVHKIINDPERKKKEQSYDLEYQSKEEVEKIWLESVGVKL